MAKDELPKVSAKIPMPPVRPPADARAKLQELNPLLKGMGLPELELVDPKALRPRDLNARYMDQQMMDNLVANLKKDKRLESVPLVFRNPEGRLEIISGHHRVEAAIKAELPLILVMVTDAKTQDEVVAKQLSHNAIAGKDDEFTLKKLFDMIGDIDLKQYAGMGDTLKDIGIQSLSYTPKLFAELTLFLADSEVEHFDAVAARLEEVSLRQDVKVRVGSLKDEERFKELLMKVKHRENIKSNAVAFCRIIEYADRWAKQEYGKRTPEPSA